MGKNCVNVCEKQQTPLYDELNRFEYFTICKRLKKT
uniref:Uncharacterized protein n=1 Tax=Anguilla anguilla TaxID=7936 RepID=A0A0E9WAB5_ANGAN